MVRANIKTSEGVYIGLIDEEQDGFRIVWNRNLENYPDYNPAGSEAFFPSYETACQMVYSVSQDVRISETIYFKAGKK